MAVNFAGTADYINLGTMGNLGTGLDSAALGVSFWIITTDTNDNSFMGVLNTGSTTGIDIVLNEQGDLTNTAGAIRIFRRDEDNNGFRSGVDTDTGYTDGSPHNIICNIANTHGGSTIFVDGVSQTVVLNTTINTGLADNMANFEFFLPIGCLNNRNTPQDFIASTNISDVIIRGTAFTQAEATLIYESKIKGLAYQLAVESYYPLDDLEAGHTGINNDTFKDRVGGNDGTGVDVNDNSTILAEAILSYPQAVYPVTRTAPVAVGAGFMTTRTKYWGA